MATTSIWHVKGYLGQVLIYVENPDKTNNPKYHEISGVCKAELSGLADVMSYATSPTKTEERLFVSGVNCDVDCARAQMLNAKRKFEKDGGIVAWHGYQSFKPGETMPSVAHEIGVKLAKEVWGDRFQVVVATHLDKGHLHNHFVLNSVSYVDGKRYTRTEREYYKLKNASDRLCKEYGLSVIDSPKRGRSKHYAEWQAENSGKETWRSVIKSGVDECIKRAATEHDFFGNLKALGYEYKIGKDISVRPPQKERFFRLERNFGESYSYEAIKQKIARNDHSHQILPVPTRRLSTFNPPKKLPVFVRGSIVALHRHYLYLMGYYERHGNPTTNARTHYLLRDDLRKLDEYIADTFLLERKGIEDVTELCAFKTSCECEIKSLKEERTKIRNALRVTSGRGHTYTTKDNPRYLEINMRLKQLRGEVKQATRIEQRSRLLDVRIEQIERDEEKKLNPRKDKEDKGNGRSRTGNRFYGKDNINGR